MVTVDDVRRVALGLPRTTEHLIHDRVKFRVKQLVYVAFSRDEELMGFAFPKEERAALVASDPDRFLLPPTSDLRFNWVQVRTAMVEVEEIDRAGHRGLDDGGAQGRGSRLLHRSRLLTSSPGDGWRRCHSSASSA